MAVRVFFLSLALSLAPLIATATPHILNYAGGADLTVLNPLLPEAAPNYNLNFLTCAYLTRYGRGGLQPELLAHLPTQKNGGIAADGKSITFTLRPDLHWSDGEPLTSADLAFSIALINDQKTLTRYHPDYDKIVAVETPNALTAVLHLRQPFGQAVATYFSSRNAPILPKHLLGGVDVNTAPYMQLPVGAGPFRYVRWTRGDRVELERNPQYALAASKLERIVLRLIPTPGGTVTALRTGEIDIATGLAFSDVAPLTSDAHVSLFTRSGVRPSLLLLNATHGPLADLRIRRALRLATNRPALVQRSYLGAAVLSESLTSSADPLHAQLPLTPHDAAAAGALLDRAGYRRGTDGMRAKAGRPLALEIAGSSGSTYVDQLIEQVRADWTAIGVTVTSKRYPLSLLFAPIGQRGILYGGKFDVALFSQGEQNAAETAATYRCAEIPPNGANVSRWCDRTHDTLVERADATYDAEAAGALYAKSEAFVNDAVPSIVLAKRNEVYPYHKDVVTGVQWWPYAFFFDPGTIDVVK